MIFRSPSSSARFIALSDNTPGRTHSPDSSFSQTISRKSLILLNLKSGKSRFISSDTSHAPLALLIRVPINTTLRKCEASSGEKAGCCASSPHDAVSFPCSRSSSLTRSTVNGRPARNCRLSKRNFLGPIRSCTYLLLARQPRGSVRWAFCSPEYPRPLASRLRNLLPLSRPQPHLVPS